MTLREFLTSLSDAGGPAEDSLWKAFTEAERLTNCDAIQGAEFAPDRDLFVVQFSYFSVGVIGLGYAFLHGTPEIFVLPQFGESEDAKSYPSQEFLDQSLLKFAICLAQTANDFCAEFEADKWGPDGPPTKPAEDVK